MSIWRYYLKMVHYEQFFIPATMAVICLVLILLMQTSPNPSASTSVATAFVEAALPLAAAMIATAVFLNDPVLELLYTLPRPLWRTLLEKMVLLIAVMTVFYLLFVAALRLVDVPLTGWGSSFGVWLIPALAWLGLTFFGGASLSQQHGRQRSRRSAVDRRLPDAYGNAANSHWTRLLSIHDRFRPEQPRLADESRGTGADRRGWHQLWRCC